MSWWHDAVIYQVYPRSFQDSDGDGIGDLAGIERRLDHIAGLGATALWLSPIYPSPLRRLRLRRERLQGRRSRVRQRSRRSTGWSPRPTSAACGCCWTWCRATPRSSTRGSPSTPTGTSGPTAATRPAEQLARRLRRARRGLGIRRSGRWYLHSFYPEQPDLDWRNPEVVAGDAGRGPVLAGPRRGRLPHRRHRPAAEGPRAARRPAGHEALRAAAARGVRARWSTSTPPTARTSAHALAALREAAGRRAAGGRGLPARRADRPLPRAPRRRVRVRAASTRPGRRRRCGRRSRRPRRSNATTAARGGVGALEPRFPARCPPGSGAENARAAAVLLLTLPGLGVRLPGRGDRPGRRPGRASAPTTAPAGTPTAIRCSGSPTRGRPASPTASPGCRRWTRASATWPRSGPAPARCSSSTAADRAAPAARRPALSCSRPHQASSRFDAASTSWP